MCSDDNVDLYWTKNKTIGIRLFQKLVEPIKLVVLVTTFITKTEIRRGLPKPPCEDLCPFSRCIVGAVCVFNPVTCTSKCKYSTDIKQKFI